MSSLIRIIRLSLVVNYRYVCVISRSQSEVFCDINADTSAIISRYDARWIVGACVRIFCLPLSLKS